MVIKKLVWDEWNKEHIARHHVSQEEVEEICRNKRLSERGRSGLYKVIGQADTGRYLTIILVPKGNGNFRPVTARDADKKEKRRLKKKR